MGRKLAEGCGTNVSMRYIFYCFSLVVFCALTVCLTPASASPPRFQFWALSRFDRSSCAVASASQGMTLTTPLVTTEGPWDELIVSWNADISSDAALEVFARAEHAGRFTRWYSLGFWANSGHRPARTSRKSQKDADGDVKTDTLCLNHPANCFQIKAVAAKSIRLRFLSAIATNTRAVPSERPGSQPAWGHVLAVPAISQRQFAGGDAWCSPTSVSMVLDYWARTSGRPEWKRTPQQCAKGIYDAAWDGTGNWPFNTAYAGSFPGMRAYVTRLDDVRALEDWLAQGVPVVLSVSIDLNAPDDRPGPAGHLIVCTGFTPKGDLIVNDPWADPSHGESITRTVPRRLLDPLWAKSEHTVYIIHPDTIHPPQENLYP